MFEPRLVSQRACDLVLTGAYDELVRGRTGGSDRLGEAARAGGRSRSTDARPLNAPLRRKTCKGRLESPRMIGSFKRDGFSKTMRLSYDQTQLERQRHHLQPVNDLTATVT